MTDPALPTIRPVPVEAVVERPAGDAVAQAVLVVLGVLAVTGALWWATGVDVSYGVVVGATALAVVGRGPVTWRRAVRGLLLTLALTGVGAVALGAAGVGAGPAERLVQGAGGVLAAALVLLVLSLRRRARRQPMTGTAPAADPR